MKSKRSNCFTMPNDQWEGYNIAYDNFPQNTEEVWNEFEQMAKELHDGHYTILKFTKGYKAALGTPELFGTLGRFQVQLLPNFLTAVQAVGFAAMWNISFDNLSEEAEELFHN